MLIQKIEEQLALCECGGSFQLHARRRCLYCGHLLNQRNRTWNVWFASFLESDGNEEQEQGLIRNKKIWKKTNRLILSKK